MINRYYIHSAIAPRVTIWSDDEDVVVRLIKISDEVYQASYTPKRTGLFQHLLLCSFECQLFRIATTKNLHRQIFNMKYQ